MGQPSLLILAGVAALHQTRHETAAAELERSAARARARGGSAAAAAFLRRAAEISAEPAARAGRALEAAHEAGATDAARELSAMAAAGPLDALRRARLQLLRAQIAFRTTRGSDAPAMLMDAAATLVPLDAALARETYLQAIEASFHAGRLGRDRGLLEAAEAGLAAPTAATPPRPVDVLIEGLATTFRHGYEAGVPVLQRALTMLHADTDDDNRRWLWLACHVAATLWDDEAIHALAERDVRLGRAAGALATLPAAVNALSSTLVLTGEFARAAELIAEEQAIAEITGAPRLPNARLTLASWSGRRSETRELYATVIADATARGEGATVGMAEVALAYLYNGVGDYDAALAAATAACEYDELAYSSVALPELVEAAVRSGEPDRAAAAAERLSGRAHASHDPVVATDAEVVLGGDTAGEVQRVLAGQHHG
ncbi:LuxR family transcriptional regulator, partial [Pseudonocardia sp. NPDC049635]